MANAFWTLTETANGTYVTYTCVDGYQLTAGSLTRVCSLSDPRLYEKPPICTCESMCVCVYITGSEGDDKRLSYTVLLLLLLIVS